MAKGKKEGEPARIRAFVALIPPDRVRDGLAAWQGEALAGRPFLRGVGRDALHMTLAFLGHRPAAEIEAARGVLAQIEPRPVTLRLEPQPVGVPPRRPRVIAFGASSPDAAALQRELAGRLTGAGAHEPEDRPFWPHVSVLRVRGGALKGAAGRSLVQQLPPLPDAATEPFGAVRVALYRSQLRSQGACYSALADVDLPPDEAADEVI